MKKILFTVLILVLTVYGAFGITLAPGYVPEGLLTDIDFSYGRTFRDGKSIMTLEGWLTAFPAPVFAANIGYSFMFSPHLSVWELYGCVGMTVYPFRKILSFSFGIGTGLSFLLLLNHFPYFVDVRMNLDIPLYKNHHLTVGAGLLHRNTIKLINYVKFKNFYGIHNTYFFQVGYRFIIKPGDKR